MYGYQHSSFFFGFLLLISDKSPEFTNFTVILLIEIKAILFPIPNLQQVVIECFLGDADLLSGTFKRLLEIIPILIIEPSIELPPESNLLNNLTNPLFLLPLAVLLLLEIFILVLLLLNECIDGNFLFVPNLDPKLHHE